MTYMTTLHVAVYCVFKFVVSAIFNSICKIQPRGSHFLRWSWPHIHYVGEDDLELLIVILLPLWEGTMSGSSPPLQA